MATCNAIAELITPTLPNAVSRFISKQGDSDPPSCKDEDKVFQNILGLIMASLISEAYIETTDKWIAIAYRLLLDRCTTDLDDTAQDWRGLFSGIQVN
jgi:hypothetical protein